MSCSLVFLIILLVSSTSMTFGQVIPSVTIYNNRSIEDSTFSIQTKVDRPDLAATWKYFSDDTHICATGIWILYWDAENYGPGSNYYPSVRSKCETFTRDAYIGSARQAGIDGTTRLNLYSGTYYTGNAEAHVNSSPDFRGDFSSLLLVGTESVQLFLEPQYGGFSYCVPCPIGSFTYIRDLAKEIGIEPGEIRSFRFGCSTDAQMIQITKSVHPAVVHE